MRPGPLRSASRRVLATLLAAVIAVLIWIVVLSAFHISPLVGKSPSDVWTYLVSGPDAVENRDVQFGYLGVTLRDAGVGYLVGLAASFVLGVAFTLSGIVEKVFTPGVMLMRSIPLVVMTPLVTLVFGVNLWSVAVITTLIVFFPATINIMAGLRRVNPQLVDLVRAHNGSTWTVLWKVSFASSLPALFASARLAVPAAMTGALVGEWLVTGEGLGGSVSRASATFGYGEMWASAVLITVVTMVLYAIVSALDGLVVHRFGAPRGTQ
ncbi:MAG: ABC transporter permease subunit [Microbacterium sp.]